MNTFPSALRLNGLVRTGPVNICRRDVRLILAMIDAGLKDQQIHAFFSQPGHDLNLRAAVGQSILPATARDPRGVASLSRRLEYISSPLLFLALLRRSGLL